MENTIPCRIIQTGKRQDLPLAARASVASLTCLNPRFEHHYFDDSAVIRFIELEFPEYLPIFKSFPFRIQKYDFFRYLVIFRRGGFYFDLDVYLATPLDDLLSFGCVFPFEELTLNRHLRRHYGMDWEIGNYAFGAAPGHPFLEAVISNCVRAQSEPGWVEPMLKGIPGFFRSDFYVLNTTGPGLLTRTLAENPGLHDSVHVLFPEDVCDSNNWHQFGHYGVHMMEGSWRDKGSFLHRRLASLWENWTLKKMLKQSVTKGKSRSLSALSGVDHSQLTCQAD